MMMLITFNDDQTIADLATFWVLTNHQSSYVVDTVPTLKTRGKEIDKNLLSNFFMLENRVFFFSFF